MLFCHDIQRQTAGTWELAFGLLANNLRFVVPNSNESNKSRWKTCRFWERFLGAVEVLKVQVPKLHNSLEETQQWLTEGGVISAVKSFYFLEEHDALGGLEKVGTMLDKARYSNSLSSKLTAHLQRINRTDLIPYIQYDTKQGKGYLMNNNDIPVWEKYTLTIEEASKYFRIGENKLRRLAEENKDAGWLIMNGNRIQIKRRQFEKVIDKLNAI